MSSPSVRPDTVNKLRFAVDAAFAMLAGVQLDVFTPLQNGALTVEEIANALGVQPQRLRLLLYSLVAAGLLTEQEGHFANTAEANKFLVKGSPFYVDNTFLSHRWLINLKTAESIRTGVPQAKLDFANSPEAELEAFLRRINARTVSAAHGLLESYDFSSVKTLADVGSGGGGLAITMAKACPQMHVRAIDLPMVTPITRRIVEEEGAADRIKVITADVVRGSLPGSYDVAVLRSVIQVLSREDACLAVKNIGAALKRGGRIYIVGQILDNSRLSPPSAVGFNLNFINMFDSGESYTEQEHREWLNQAGFVDIERANFFLAEGLGVMTARKRE
jgi:2-hydroxy-4-(methylsulfanyl)butanoate S-methyltransferase